VRNGQQSAIAKDIIDLMDALNIKKAIVAGFDWGRTNSKYLAALWPERSKAMVSVSGYLIGNQQAGKLPFTSESRTPMVVPVLLCNRTWKGRL
jgi:pimeloyl-ACP methyl ester carboxylesterase